MTPVMTRNTCPNCGGNVGAAPVKCPRCGHEFARWYLWVAGIFAVLAALVIVARVV